jgi:hypothetical protein
MAFLPGAMIEAPTGLRQAAGEGTYVAFLEHLPPKRGTGSA